LREPPTALRRVRRGLVWLTRCELPRHPRTAELRAFPVVESTYHAEGDVRGRRVFLFAGIARPERFVDTIRALGAEIAGVRWFADHHRFTDREIEDVRRLACGASLVTTEKDLVRLPGARDVRAVRIDIRLLRGEDALDRALAEVV
jgi:tetraacyldisaccharide 4'-kinase